MTDCIFCKIAQGEIPTNKVYEDDQVLAFLDNSQATTGHTLLIPKQHVKDIFDYDADLAATVFSRVPKIARAIEEAFPGVEGLNIINNNRELAYQSVFHSHVHLIPRYSKNDGFKMSMVNSADKYTTKDFSDIAQMINQKIKED